MATIRKRILPSGKAVWQADYRDGEGKRKHRQFAKKSEADDFLVTVRADVRQGAHVASSASMTVDEAAKRWLDHSARLGRERATLTRYRESYDRYVKPRFGAAKLTAINAPAVQRLVDDLTGTMSLSSLKKVKSAMVSIYRHAVSRGYAATNPARDVILPEAKRGQGRPECPTKDDLRAILKHTVPRWQPLIRLATVTGMRASELRGLKWCDIDIEGCVVHVRRRVDKWNAFGPPKSHAGTRDIPISPSTAKMLADWRKQCASGELDLVFPNGGGKVESHSNLLNRVFIPAQIDAGVSIDTGKKDADGKPVMAAKFGLHSLRHAAAALFIEQGFAPKKVQSLMGHASLQMTYDVYGYLFPSEDDDRARVTAMDAALFE